eukprot:TRINITY_DN35759_c0_g1_i1.p1 TRINITY_DN35759_c0_g1~~TRINITY_DN35759_c0_g1_i1.p1  ORF type:complete len:282 (+),score=58.00 TRINITY_DN35759_c0_g1_i1:116-847(+)
MANVKGIQMYLEFPSEMQKECFQYINDLYEDAVNERIPNALYTGETLNALQDLFLLAVKEKYVSTVKDKIRYLLDHWYQKVRQMEVAGPKKRNDNGEITQLPHTKRSRSTYMKVKEEPHFACRFCTKVYKRKNACRDHMKILHPGDLELEPEYTIPQPTAPNVSGTEVDVADIDLGNLLQSTPDDQLFVFQLPENRGALLQQNFAQSVSDQELSTAPLQPGIGDYQGNNQDDFQLPAIWFDTV